jgi:tRNA pseudouridine38-40 synthase
MVRIIAGTLVTAGEGRTTPAAVAAALASRDREQAGQTAPACGLTLVEVFYED